MLEEGATVLTDEQLGTQKVSDVITSWNSTAMFWLLLSNLRWSQTWSHFIPWFGLPDHLDTNMLSSSSCYTQVLGPLSSQLAPLGFSFAHQWYLKNVLTLPCAALTSRGMETWPYAIRYVETELWLEHLSHFIRNEDSWRWDRWSNQSCIA